MTQSTFALLTTTGRSKEALALASGEPLVISAIAIGDGTTVPSGGEKKLYHEIARKTVSGHGLVAGTTNTAYFDIHLAATDGPYTIREAGLYDTAGDLIAIACYDPPINKPTPESGQTVEGDVRLQIAFSNAENVIVQVDASMQVPLQRLTVKPWVPIKSIDTKQPPENPTPGDVYVIPATATGVWKGQSQKLAEFTSAGWAITDTPDGHGIGLPDGSIYIKINGIYVPWTDLLDKRYAKFPEPPSTTFYVVGPTGNDKNSGLKPTPADGFATIQGAIDKISARYMSASAITVVISPGVYDGFSITKSMVPKWVIKSMDGNKKSVSVLATDPKKPARSACWTGVGTQVDLMNMTLSGVDDTVATTGGALKIYSCDINLGGTANSQAVVCYGGSINLYGDMTITGSGIVIFRTMGAGTLTLGFFGGDTNKIPLKVTYNNVKASWTALLAEGAATLSCFTSVVTFDGVPDSMAYSAITNGVITTQGGGTNKIFPGTRPGWLGTGGQFS